jgi:hypothetical protein
MTFDLKYEEFVARFKKMMVPMLSASIGTVPIMFVQLLLTLMPCDTKSVLRYELF